MIRLEKVGRRGGLFGVIASRPYYRTLDPMLVDGVLVPPGYETDLVSAPWWARPFMPLKHMRDAALRHDWRRKHRADLSLRQIDDMFLDDLIAAGVPWPWPGICRWAVGMNKNR